MAPARKEPDLTTLKGQFAKRIEKRRKEAGFTVEECAAAMGVTPKTWYAWESGRSVPDLNLWPDLSKTLNVSLRVLLPKHLPET